jgi:hypothetical protein
MQRSPIRRLVESLDAFDGPFSFPSDGLKKLSGHPAFSFRQGAAQGLRIVSSDRCAEACAQPFLIVVMILLQTGVLSLGLMVDRFITAVVSNRKLAH